MIKVDFDKSQIDAFGKTLKKVEKQGKMFGNEVVMKAADIFIRSASVATPPGRSGYIGANKKGIPAKSKKRKVVTISGKSQKASKTVWYYDKKKNRMFGKPIAKRFTPRERESRDIVLVTKFVEVIDTRTGKKKYKPIPPTQEAKTTKLRSIPTAGAAKLGWLGAARRIKSTVLANSKGVSRGVNYTRVKKGWNPFVYIQNNVDYITKIAPMSARKALGNATRIIEKRFLPKADREFTEMFRAKRISHAARFGVKI